MGLIDLTARLSQRRIRSNTISLESTRLSVQTIINLYQNTGGQITDENILRRQIVDYLTWMQDRYGTIELRGKLEVVPAPGEAAKVELLPEDGEPILLTVEVKRVGEDLNLFGAQIVEMGEEQFETIERLCAAWAEEEH